MALFLMLATTGISFSMHYCGGELVSTSINKEAKSCCDGKGGCCENKSIHIEIEDDYVCPVHIDVSNAEEIELLFPILFVLQAEPIEESIKGNYCSFASSPPPPIQTRLSLLQTYLC